MQAAGNPGRVGLHGRKIPGARRWDGLPRCPRCGAEANRACTRSNASLEKNPVTALAPLKAPHPERREVAA